MTTPADFGMPPTFVTTVVTPGTRAELPGEVGEPAEIIVWDKLLRGPVLVEYELPITMYNHAEFSGKILSGEVPNGSPLRSDLRWANFAHSIIINIEFMYSKLNNADFIGARLENVCFHETNLEGIILTGAVLDRVFFKGAKLKNINFSDVAKAIGVDLTGQDLVPVIKEDMGPFKSADILAIAEQNALSYGITGLIPFKLMKSTPIKPYWSEPDESWVLPAIPERPEPGIFQDEYKDPFAGSYVDVDKSEVINPDDLEYSSDKCYELAICWKIAGSNDQYGQIRGCIRVLADQYQEPSEPS